MKPVTLLSVLSLVFRGTSAASVSGSCECLTYNRVHARTGAGLSHSIIASLNHGECFRPTGDVVTHDGYHWHELENVHGHRTAWVAGDFLQTSSASHCGISGGAHFNSSNSGTPNTYATGIVSQDCLDCICHHESGCIPAGCKWDVNANSCGYFQLKEEYWNDCGSPGGSFMACALDMHCSSLCVQNYMSRFIRSSGCANNCESYARIHTGGPQGCHHSSTLHNWRDTEHFGCSANS
ncbi:lysozyme-like [Argopecten irradians]|uniref:lysozyme-like n=1 Tax=Argopecten irradians TaxID=31199 RepID=UPI0037188CAA